MKLTGDAGQGKVFGQMDPDIVDHLPDQRRTSGIGLVFDQKAVFSQDFGRQTAEYLIIFRAVDLRLHFMGDFPNVNRVDRAG